MQEIYVSCEVCGAHASDLHHVVFRSQQPTLKKCQHNLIPLRHRCHYSIHHSNGARLDKQLKLKFQNKLEVFFLKEYLTSDEINEVLNISERELNRLLKPLKMYKGKYSREETIRQIMGGRIILENEIEE